MKKLSEPAGEFIDLTQVSLSTLLTQTDPDLRIAFTKAGEKVMRQLKSGAEAAAFSN